MGFDLCWIGVEARCRKRFLDWFDLEPAGEAADELGAEFTLAETPGGWVVLAARAHGFSLDEALAGVSSSCGLAVGCEIVEGATFSRACASRHGQQLWSVTYNCGEAGGLEARGDPPSTFAGIKARLVAEQAAAADGASHLFEAPADLTASITGYRPGKDQGLEWTVLRKKQARSSPAGRRPRSLRAAMFSELIPLLRSLGWETSDRPALADLGQICRNLDGIEQMIWFDYASGKETYVIVHFMARASSALSEFVVSGRVIAPRLRVPLWKRFTWRRLGELTRYEPPPADIVGAVIDRAQNEIRIADEYLRNWSPAPCILIDFARPQAEWPVPPTEGESQSSPKSSF
jgi:hypothetical protein